MSVRAIVVTAVLVCGCRHSDVVADLEPLTTPSIELPDWFGMPDLPERRIAGQLLDTDKNPIVGRVHLRIDAPDATVWIGRDLDTGADGRFDFGTLRAGQYTLFATAPKRTSRVIEVDTRIANRGALPLYVHPCTRQWRAVSTTSGAPIANVRIDVAGTYIATTDVQGAFEVCANADPITVVARAAGFAPETDRMTNTSTPQPIVLARSIQLRGRVVGPRGKPLVGVSVHAFYVDPAAFEHVSPYEPIASQVVTDGEGRFVLRGMRELDPVTDETAKYRVRVTAHNMTLESDGTIFDVHSRDEIVVRPPPQKADPYVQSTWVEGTISGIVMYRDVPVVDAEICQIRLDVDCWGTARSRADGAFDLPVMGSTTTNVLDANLRIRHASGLSGIGHARVPAGKRIENMTIELAR